MNIFLNDKEQRMRAGWRVLVQFIIMFLLVGFGVLVGQAFHTNSFFITATIPQFIGITASVWIAARLLDHRSFFDYGITFDKTWGKEFFIGVAIAAIAMSTIFLSEWGAGWLSVTGYGWNAHPDGSFGWTMAESFVAMLMVGFHEELFSRGYQVLNLSEGLQYRRIGQKGAVAIAILLTASLFGAMHIFNPNASAISTINIIIAGVVLAIPYIFTGSLGISVGLHFSWNFTMAGIYGFPVSGSNFQTSVIRIQQTGSEVWTGGPFGPEAGIIGLIGMAIMLVLSCVYIQTAGYGLSIAELFDEEHQPAVKVDEQNR